MRRFFILLLFVLTAFLSLSCTVKVTPPLSTSLGFEAFQSMKKVDVRDVSIALYIDPKIKKLTVQKKMKMGDFSFKVGEAFSVKMLKALSYRFRKIELIDNLSYINVGKNDAIMIVQLQDVDVNLKVRAGFSTVSTEGYSRLSIRAEIKEYSEKKVVWVGTTQAKQTGTHQEAMQMQYQEAGRGFAEAIDSTIDMAIGDIMNQVSKSPNLAKYIDLWESKRK